MISFSHKFTFLYFLSHILISFPILPYHFANRMPIVKISLSIRYQLIQIEIHFLLLISYEIEYALLFVIFNPFQLSLPLEIILLSCCILSRLYISKDKDKYLCKIAVKVSSISFHIPLSFRIILDSSQHFFKRLMHISPRQL